MYKNTSSDYEKRKYGDNTAPGGGRIRADDVDPRRVDDFSERIRRKEEEKKRNQSGGQSGSRGYGHS